MYKIQDLIIQGIKAGTFAKYSCNFVALIQATIVNPNPWIVYHFQDVLKLNISGPGPLAVEVSRSHTIRHAPSLYTH